MMERFLVFGVSLVAVAGFSTIALADATTNLGSQPSRDQLIQMLAPHGAAGTERGLRVRSANPAAASAESPEATSSASKGSRTAPSVALDIKFELNSAVLTDQARDTIRRLGAAFQSNQLVGYRFRVEGYTDASGQPGYNLALSQRRAAAVRDYLVNELHVAPKRLEVVGRGEQDLADPSDPTNAVNRRVEVVNIGK
jgi:outer membrane protein OmpA-like peptidoglycan-associated protein